MEKEPIISKCVSAGSRVYYFDVYKDSKGNPYLSISEVPTGKSSGDKKRQQIFLHADHVSEFEDALNEMVTTIKGAAT